MVNHLKIERLIVFAVLLAFACSLQFGFSIAGGDKRCFSELLTESSPFHFSISSQGSDFEISLNHKDGAPLMINKRQETTKKIDSYTSVTDEYYFCIINHSDYRTDFVFNFFHGIQLSDLESLPKIEDGKLINEMVDKINQIYQMVKSQQDYSQTVNEYNMELQKLVSFKSVGFVFLSITIVLIISFFHFLQIKRVLKNRKII